MKPSLLLCIGYMLTSCAVDKTKIDEASGLLGVWKVETESEVVYESWTKKSAREYAGVSYLLRAGDTVTLETIQLVEENGELYYIPTVVDQNDAKPIRFTCNSITSTHMTFENLVHDFPQIISYRWVSADSMVAEISGTVGAEVRKRDFPMKRVKKPGNNETIKKR